MSYKEFIDGKCKDICVNSSADICSSCIGGNLYKNIATLGITLKPCPYCGKGVLRKTFGIRASLEECTQCDKYLCVEHNSAEANPQAGIPLYKHMPVNKELKI